MKFKDFTCKTKTHLICINEFFVGKDLKLKIKRKILKKNKIEFYLEMNIQLRH